VGELSAGLYGHSNPTIHSAITNTLSTIGLNLGGNTSHEVTYASLLCSRFNLDRVRFTNSGTEANLHAIAGAKRVTGRRKVVVFGGAYHGAVLGFDERGKEMGNTVDRGEWIGGRFNDVEGAKRLIEEETEGGVAAVLVEGMQGAAGCVLGTEAFLKQVEESARKVCILMSARAMLGVFFGGLTRHCIGGSYFHLGRGDDFPAGSRWVTDHLRLEA
jgi:glutamate-1-semialdehyde 2,1-aminomutase